MSRRIELVFANIAMCYDDENEYDPLVRLSFDLNGIRQHWVIRHLWDWNSAAFLSPLNEFARGNNAWAGREVENAIFKEFGRGVVHNLYQDEADDFYDEFLKEWYE